MDGQEDPHGERVRNVWGLRLPVLPDEILTSWLVRAALAQGCDPLILTGSLWPGWRAWARDLDRGPTGERLVTAAQTSGLDVSTLIAATLRPTAEAVVGRSLPTDAAWPWMLVTGSRNRLRRGGMQFCPYCLAEDRQPYYRRRWRLAWHTGCARHQTILLDACPYCATPLEPHRLTINDAGLASCASCRADLRLSSPATASPAAVALQTAADHCVSGLCGSFAEDQLSCPDWFALVRYFVTILRSVAGNRHDGLTALVSSIGVDVASLPAPATGLAFEFLPSAERAPLLAAAWVLLGAGPVRFLDAALQYDVAANALDGPRTQLPACLAEAVAQLVGRGRLRIFNPGMVPASPNSRSHAVRQWARLRRKARIGTPVDVGVLPSRPAPHIPAPE